MGEKCKVSIRNIRREANDELKKMLKEKKFQRMIQKKEKIIQDHTDSQIKLIEERLFQKKRNNDNMNVPSHVAIIVDGNGKMGS